MYVHPSPTHPQDTSSPLSFGLLMDVTPGKVSFLLLSSSLVWFFFLSRLYTRCVRSLVHRIDESETLPSFFSLDRLLFSSGSSLHSRWLRLVETTTRVQQERRIDSGRELLKMTSHPSMLLPWRDFLHNLSSKRHNKRQTFHGLFHKDSHPQTTHLMNELRSSLTQKLTRGLAG